MDIKIGDLVLMDEGLGWVGQIKELKGNYYYVIYWCDDKKVDSYTVKSSILYGKEALQTYLSYANRGYGCNL